MHQYSNNSTNLNTRSSKKSYHIQIMFEVVNLSKFKHKKYLLMMDLICRNFTVRSKLCKLSKPLLMMALIYKISMALKRRKLNQLSQSLLMMVLIFKISMELKRQLFLWKLLSLCMRMMDWVTKTMWEVVSNL